jgi:hypothetical protein
MRRALPFARLQRLFPVRFGLLDAGDAFLDEALLPEIRIHQVFLGGLDRLSLGLAQRLQPAALRNQPHHSVGLRLGNGVRIEAAFRVDDREDRCRTNAGCLGAAVDHGEEFGAIRSAAA